MNPKVHPEDILVEEQRLIALATGSIERAMDLADVTQAQVAEMLGVSAAHVSQVLDGTRNMTLRTIAGFGLACGVRWNFGMLKTAAALSPYTSPAPACVGATITHGPLTGAVAAAPYFSWN